MIFGTWRSYFISWQIFENKLWCPVRKKIRRYLHFLFSLAYPIDRPDWALFSVVILFCCWRTLKFGPFFCPTTSPRFWSFLWGGAGNPPRPFPQCGAGNPPFPAGWGVHPCYIPYILFHILYKPNVIYYVSYIHNGQSDMRLLGRLYTTLHTLHLKIW